MRYVTDILGHRTVPTVAIATPKRQHVEQMLDVWVVHT
jgi:hypothetical protein